MTLKRILIIGGIFVIALLLAGCSGKDVRWVRG